jgi:hypothetical protein
MASQEITPKLTRQKSQKLKNKKKSKGSLRLQIEDNKPTEVNISVQIVSNMPHFILVLSFFIKKKKNRFPMSKYVKSILNQCPIRNNGSIA